MGGGNWTTKAFKAYSLATKNASMGMDGKLDLSGRSTQEIYAALEIDDALRITGRTVRECRDSEEHPATVPVILALDVTGSMGSAAMEVAAALNKVMTDLYKSVKDVEFMVMAIGDLAYDDAPVQVSQFESDIRIAEHLDKVYFEGGGGGNSYESYTLAWYVGARHTDLDCWKRGAKGLIITIGDEPLNPYLPAHELRQAIQLSEVQGDVNTMSLREEIRGKYDIAHIHVNHDNGSRLRQPDVAATCKKYDVPLHISNVNAISDVIVELVKEHADGACNGSFAPTETADAPASNDSGDITW